MNLCDVNLGLDNMSKYVIKIKMFKPVDINNYLDKSHIIMSYFGFKLSMSRELHAHDEQPII